MDNKANASRHLLHTHLSRRTFVKKSAAAVGFGLVAGDIARGAAAPLMGKRVLGRTGLEVTDIGFGGNQLQQPRLLEVALDMGINLVHTGRGYTGGASLRATGEVMKTRRDDVVLCLQASPVGGIDEDLKELNTDHVDILLPQMHAAEHIEDPELEVAFAKLKEEGKIRFAGFANHKDGPTVISIAIEKGFYDVMLVAYNLGNRNEIDPVLAKAVEEQNMGFMAMKSFRGLEKEDPESVAAGLKQMLRNDNVHSLLIGMGAVTEVESNVAISGARMGWMDHVRARKFAHLGTTACAMCGTCETACPRGVAVADILRHKLYYDRGEQTLGISSYRSLPAGASLENCDACGICASACPRSRPVLNELHQAELLLA